ncbi:6454_t:CDS:2, partial [Racocetra persica]
ADAEKYHAEDEKVAQRIQALNGLKRYAYNLRNTLQQLEDAIQEATTWLKNNQEAEKEVYEHKQKSLEEAVNTIIMKLYDGESNSDFPEGPTIEE